MSFPIKDRGGLESTLLQNPSFENTGSWLLLGTPSIAEQSTTRFFDGAYSYHITTDSNNEGIYQNLTGLEVDTYYYASARIWVTNSKRVWVEIRDASNNLLQRSGNTTTAGWNEPYIRFVNNTPNIRFCVLGEAGADFYVDYTIVSLPDTLRTGWGKQHIINTLVEPRFLPVNTEFNSIVLSQLAYFSDVDHRVNAAIATDLNTLAQFIIVQENANGLASPQGHYVLALDGVKNCAIGDTLYLSATEAGKVTASKPLIAQPVGVALEDALANNSVSIKLDIMEPQIMQHYAANVANLQVAASSPPDSNILINTGYLWFDRTIYRRTTVTIVDLGVLSAVTGTNYNKILISIDADNNTVTTVGTQNALLASVIAPTLPPRNLPLAFVTIRGDGLGGITNIEDTAIEDVRPFINSGGGDPLFLVEQVTNPPATITDQGAAYVKGIDYFGTEYTELHYRHDSNGSEVQLTYPEGVGSPNYPVAGSSLKLPEQGSYPSTLLNIGAVFTQNVLGTDGINRTDLFFRSDNDGSIIRLTNSEKQSLTADPLFLVEKGVVPTTPIDTGVLYTKNVLGTDGINRTDLFFRSDNNGVEIQITNSERTSLTADPLYLSEIAMPSTAANQGVVFAADDGGETHLFYRFSSNGATIRLSSPSQLPSVVGIGGLPGASNPTFRACTISDVGDITNTATGPDLMLNSTADTSPDQKFIAARVYNPGLADIVDCRKAAVGEEIVPGLCYYQAREGLRRCKHYCQMGVAGIVSDTYGYALGTGEGNNAPIAIGGYVLAYVDKEYEPGTPLTNDMLGRLTEMDLESKRNYPERIVATYVSKESALTWGPTNFCVKVNGRHWVKVC